MVADPHFCRDKKERIVRLPAYTWIETLYSMSGRERADKVQRIYESPEIYPDVAVFLAGCDVQRHATTTIIIIK